MSRADPEPAEQRPPPLPPVAHVTLADGTPVTIRPIRPDDALIEQTFVRRLSPRSRYFRFMQAIDELTPVMLARFTCIDPGRELALIATVAVGEGEAEIAVARYVADADGAGCEFALAVADEWRRKGLGSRMLRLLMEHARSRGLRMMEGGVLGGNLAMLALARRLGFTVEAQDGGLCRISRRLDGVPP